MGTSRSGRRKPPLQIASVARGYTTAVLKALAGIVIQEDVPAAARIAAGRELLDRGWGKALQKVELDGDRPPQILEIITTIVDPQDPDNPIEELDYGLSPGHTLPAPEANELVFVSEPSEPEPETS